MNTIIDKNKEYWSGRAPGYSDVNKEELTGIQRDTWKKLLDEKIMEHFAGRNLERKHIRILDIGAGPGFISIILTEQGYNVTASDFCPEMLEEARNNAGNLADRITFRQEDAMNLSFEDESFDVVFSRNLTWNLPRPEDAYRQWLRVLKKDGVILVFDANWYAFLFDEGKKAEYDNDRKNVSEQGLEDYNIGENFEIMDKIAYELPLSRIQRPDWDVEVFKSLGVSEVSFSENIGEYVYSEKEKINYASTPMFMIRAVK
jgi:SAM-dependent methyltransferase